MTNSQCDTISGGVNYIVAFCFYLEVSRYLLDSNSLQRKRTQDFEASDIVQRRISNLMVGLIEWRRFCCTNELVPRYVAGCLASKMCGLSYQPHETLAEWPTEFSFESLALDDRKDVGLIKIVSRAGRA